MAPAGRFASTELEPATCFYLLRAVSLADVALGMRTESFHGMGRDI